MQVFEEAASSKARFTKETERRAEETMPETLFTMSAKKKNAGQIMLNL